MERRKSHKINFYSICVLCLHYPSYLIVLYYMQNWCKGWWCTMQAINFIFIFSKHFCIIMLFLSKIDFFEFFYSTKWKCNDELWFMGYEIKCVALNKLSFYTIKISTTLLNFVVNIYPIRWLINLLIFFQLCWQKW